MSSLLYLLLSGRVKIYASDLTETIKILASDMLKAMLEIRQLPCPNHRTFESTDMLKTRGISIWDWVWLHQSWAVPWILWVRWRWLNPLRPRPCLRRAAYILLRTSAFYASYFIFSVLVVISSLCPLCLIFRLRLSYIFTSWRHRSSFYVNPP
jgi:hypothetical protein